MEGQLSTEVSVRKNVAILTVVGDARGERSTDLLHAMLAAIDGPYGPSVVVDVAGVTSFDDGALDILGMGGRAAQLLGGTLHVASPSPAVMDAILQRLSRPRTGRRSFKPR